MQVHADVTFEELLCCTRRSSISQSIVGQFDEAFSLSDGKFNAEFLGHCKRFLGLIMLRKIKESPGIGLDIPLKREINSSVPVSACSKLGISKS